MAKKRGRPRKNPIPEPKVEVFVESTETSDISTPEPDLNKEEAKEEIKKD